MFGHISRNVGRAFGPQVLLGLIQEGSLTAEALIFVGQFSIYTLLLATLTKVSVEP